MIRLEKFEHLLFYNFALLGPITDREKFKLTNDLQVLTVTDTSTRRRKLKQSIGIIDNKSILITPNLSHLANNLNDLESIFEKIILRSRGSIYLVDTDELIVGESLVSINLLISRLAQIRKSFKELRVNEIKLRGKLVESVKIQNGRPSVISNEIKKEIMALAERGLSSRKISRTLSSISKSTVHRYLSSEKKNVTTS